MPGSATIPLVPTRVARRSAVASRSPTRTIQTARGPSSITLMPGSLQQSVTGRTTPPLPWAPVTRIISGQAMPASGAVVYPAPPQSRTVLAQPAATSTISTASARAHSPDSARMTTIHPVQASARVHSPDSARMVTTTVLQGRPPSLAMQAVKQLAPTSPPASVRLSATSPPSSLIMSAAAPGSLQLSAAPASVQLPVPTSTVRTTVSPPPTIRTVQAAPAVIRQSSATPSGQRVEVIRTVEAPGLMAMARQPSATMPTTVRATIPSTARVGTMRTIQASQPVVIRASQVSPAATQAAAGAPGLSVRGPNYTAGAYEARHQNDDLQLKSLKDLRRTSGLKEVPVSEGLQSLQKGAEDGMLTRAQFMVIYQEILQRHGIEVPSEEVRSAVWDLFDRDGNHVVDMLELICGISLLCAGTEDEKIHAVFDVFDENGDGFISMNEMFKFLTSVFKVVLTPNVLGVMNSMGVNVESPEDLASVTALECFRSADINNDGKLSVTEFKEWFFLPRNDPSSLFSPARKLLQ